MSTQFPEVFALGLEDKLKLVEALWDSIGAQSQQLPIPDWQKAELDSRKASALANPDDESTWDEAKF